MKRIRFSVIVLTVLVISFLVIAPSYLYGVLTTAQPMQRQQEDEREIVRVWHVDSWEGGINSRATWLTNRAKAYEKANPGVYFEIRSYTPTQVQTMLQEGDEAVLPDMLSFGAGIVNQPQRLLRPLVSPDGVKEPLLRSASVGNTLYAQPYLMGGYGLIVREEGQDYHAVLKGLKDHQGKQAALTVGRGIMHFPALSVVMSDKGDLFGAVKESAHRRMGQCLPSVAWQDFSDGEAEVLIGSQRDIYRMQESKCFLAPSGAGYTDLVQYIGVMRHVPTERAEVCSAFICSLLTVESQQKLSALWLFPALKELQLYGDKEALSALGQSLEGELTVCPAFVTEEELKKAGEAAVDYLLGKEEAKETVEKFKLICIN